MEIAIIGAGLAGLAAAHYLLQREGISVTLFEAERVGAGASGAASGLVHPYPGIMARRSARAWEAMERTKELLRVAERSTPKMVATHAGILRRSLNEEQHARLVGHCAAYGDVERVDERLFLIHCGITVHMSHYLEGLATAVRKCGAEIRIQQIGSLKELSHFDHIIIACGYGIKAFEECSALQVKFLKGQVLQLQGTPQFARSMISKGYMAHLGWGTHFEIGSTYERQFDRVEPDERVARALLQGRLAECSGASVVGCRAGVRVCRHRHYLPIVEKVAPGVSVFTALGSRGLLYHALFAHALANELEIP